MQLYRLCRQRFAELSGLGAKLTGGRWNRRGLSALYTAKHASLAVLEVLVHLDRSEIPTDYVMLEISAPDDCILAIRDHRDPRLAELTRQGFVLLRDRYVGFSVPSAIVPYEDIVVLYPESPLATKLSKGKIVPFAFDKRLFAATPKVLA